MGDESFDSILGALYDGAVTPALWLDALKVLSRAFRSHHVGHIVNSSDRSAVRGVAIGIDEAAHAAFLHRWHRTNLIAHLAMRQAGPIVRSSALMPADRFRRTPIYEDHFKPHDLAFGLRVSLRQDAAGSSVLSMNRGSRTEDFSDAELMLVKRLLPHLRRADLIRMALHEANLGTQAAWAALDVLPHPLLVLDGDRRVMRANLEAARVLTEGQGLRVMAGLLQVAPTDTRALKQVLARAVPAGGGRGQAGSLQLRRLVGPPLLLVAMPLSPEALPGPVWDLSARPAALLCFVDRAARSAQPPPALLRDLFGLTAAETAVAQALIAGETVTDIAAMSSRSLATVRSHLARLLFKTGTTRQADLARLLARLPTWRPKD